MKAQFPVCFTNLNEAVPRITQDPAWCPALLEEGSLAGRGLGLEEGAFLHKGRAFTAKLLPGLGSLRWVTQNKTQSQVLFLHSGPLTTVVRNKWRSFHIWGLLDPSTDPYTLMLGFRGCHSEVLRRPQPSLLYYKSYFGNSKCTKTENS